MYVIWTVLIKLGDTVFVSIVFHPLSLPPPGLAHIFHAGFITPKQNFWCEAAYNDAWQDSLDAASHANWSLTPEQMALPDSADTSSGLNTGPWPVHYKYNKTGATKDMFV